MRPSVSQSIPEPGSKEEQARNMELMQRELLFCGPRRETQFAPGKNGVLFFCRGRGRGHAIPDISIIKELERLNTDADTIFVSYATGADMLCEFGYPVIDLGLPEDNFVWDTTVLAGRLIESLNPALVVAHEEFAALVASGAFEIPAVFITHWFMESDTFEMQSLRRANDIIFIDFPGQFSEPPYLEGKVHYVGPVVRDFEYDTDDREHCRKQLDISPDTTVITVLPGSWTENMAPTYDLVLKAVRELGIINKKLIWMAGSDYSELSKKSKSFEWIEIIEKDWQIDRLMVASDVVITKANRNTVVELAHLKIPSISLTYHLNEMDDISIGNIDSNTTLEATTLHPKKLAEYLQKILNNNEFRFNKMHQSKEQLTPAAHAANIIHSLLNKG